MTETPAKYSSNLERTCTEGVPRKHGSGFVITCTLEINGRQFPDCHIEGSADLLDGVVQDWTVDTIVVCDHCRLPLSSYGGPDMLVAEIANRDAIQEAIQKFFELR